MEGLTPPFYSRTDELLYKIYLKLQGGSMPGLTANDINTLSKLNAILEDAELISQSQFNDTIMALRGNVPVSANTLEKLYSIIQGMQSLKREDIDTLEELNAILSDADLVRIQDLADALVALNLKQRNFQFYFPDSHWDDDHNQSLRRDRFVMRGKITDLANDFTNALSAVSYKTRIDTSSTWAYHLNVSALQNWINANISGNEQTGTRYWIRCIPTYKSGHDGEAVSTLTYNIQT
jgi:hypothetical protein